MTMNLRVAIVVGALATTASGAAAQTPQVTQDLRRLSLEELLQMEVTVVTRQSESIGTAAAAVSVITRDDIRRSGVTTIADAVALADGMHVARFNNGTWSTTARGFNGSTPNKLLVMVDGRNAFTPFFTGVFWNTLDYVLEDIERIEVLRGPGASLWGANAVNGVVNIITRHTRDTRGTYVLAGGGNEDRGLIEVRHGGGSVNTSYRIYAKAAERAGQKLADGSPSEDPRRRAQAGFRLDSTRGATQWLFKADALHSRDAFPDRRDGEWSEINVQGRFNRSLTPTSQLQVQSYYRREYRNIERQLTHHVDTGDIDLLYSAAFGGRHNLISGGGVRVNRDTTHGSAALHFDPMSRVYPVFSAFVQDEFALWRNAVALTGGVKVEHNSFSGADWQPNLRVRWLMPRQQVLWGAAARAVRRPTRFDDDIRITAPNGLLLVQGSDDFEAEIMTGWEVGYRARPIRAMSFDATVFVQNYPNLRSQEAPLVGPVPVTIGNGLEGRSAGVELSSIIQPHDRLRVHASYTFLDTEISRRPGSRDVSGGANEANDPRHLGMLRASVNLMRTVEADVWLRAVGALPNPVVPAYQELNARVGWRPSAKIELALVGQDLLHAQHPEFGANTPRRVEFERSVRALFTLRLP
jgi:iron complex outermembrane receptor protein